MQKNYVVIEMVVFQKKGQNWYSKKIDTRENLSRSHTIIQFES